MTKVFITGIVVGLAKPTSVTDLEAAVALLAQPFRAKPFRPVVDHVGVGREIERHNDALHNVTRAVLTNFGIAEMLDLNA